jgi:hypothetical protein
MSYFKPLIAAGLAAAVALPLSLSAAAETPWTFVSMPDWLNADLGDLSSLPNYQGDNSTTPSWETAIDSVMGSIQAENPDFVMVAGDMTMARWIQDGLPTIGGQGLFGPTLGSNGYNQLDLATENQRVRNASELYYNAWNKRFTDRGMVAYTAIGDHELGDDSPTWNTQSSTFNGNTVQWGNLGRETISTYRDTYAEYFVDPIRNGDTGRLAQGSTFIQGPSSGQHASSAYAIKHNNTLMVSIDVFKQPTAQDRPIITVDGDQLTWLDQTLAAANLDSSIDHIIVQGHTPVLMPVNARNSGQLKVEDAENSALWQTLKTHNVDMYLSGEVHDITVNQNSDESLIQIVHGGFMGFDDSIIDSQTYLVGQVYSDRMELTLKELGVDANGGNLFQPGNPGTKLRENIILDPNGFQDVGQVTISTVDGRTRFLGATGAFAGLINPILPVGSFNFDKTVPQGEKDTQADKTVDQQPANATFSDFTLSNVTEFVVSASSSDSGAGNLDRLGMKEGWGTGNEQWIADTYVGFSVTADDGYTLELNGLEFVISRGNIANSHRDARLLIIDDEGNQTAIEIMDDLIAFDGQDLSGVNNTDFEFALDLIAENLGDSESWEFRWQFADTDGQDRVIRLDNVGLDFTAVAIPEPASALSLIAAAMALMGRRR